MTKVSVVQAKARFSEIIAAVEAGHDVLITRRGVPVARLSGIDRARRPLALAAIDAFRAKLPPAHQRSIDLLRSMRDESL